MPPFTFPLSVFNGGGKRRRRSYVREDEEENEMEGTMNSKDH